MGRDYQWGVALSSGWPKSEVIYRASLVLGLAYEWRVLGTSLLAAGCKIGLQSVVGSEAPTVSSLLLSRPPPCLEASIGKVASSASSSRRA